MRNGFRRVRLTLLIPTAILTFPHLVSSPVSGSVLYSYERSLNETIDMVASTLQPSFFDVPAGTDPFDPSFDVFHDQAPWLQSDSGSERVVSAANSAAFSQVTGLLTDGLPELLTVGEAVGGGSGYQTSFEAYALFGDVHDPRIDLHGNRIDDFLIQMNHLGFNSDGQNTQVSYDYTVSIEGGPVPEPASFAAALGSGMCALLRRRREPNCDSINRIRR